MDTQSSQSTKPKSENIYQRILGVMGDLDYIAKGEKTVNGQYRFVSHDQVTAKLHPLLVKHGIVITVSVADMTQEGNRTRVSLYLRFMNADDPGDWYGATFIGYGIDASDKGPGKAISYAYKYALLKTFCLETGDDPDNQADASYEPVKCMEFDGLIPEDFGDKEREKLQRFLLDCSKTMNKHVEDVKREATKRMPEFLQALKNWKPKKEDKK